MLVKALVINLGDLHDIVHWHLHDLHFMITNEFMDSLEYLTSSSQILPDPSGTKLPVGAVPWEPNPNYLHKQL